MDAAASRPPFGDPTLRFVGHYDGTPPQLEALRVNDDPRRRAPVGMDIALLVYSGISVKMLVDRTFGADMVTMFTVDYEIGGAAQAARPPVRGGLRLPRGRGPLRARWRAVHAAPGRRRLLGRRVRARVLERGHRTRPLARDPGAPAARSTRLSLGPELGAIRTGSRNRIGGNRMADDSLGRRRRRHAGDRSGDRAPLRGRGAIGRADRPGPGQRRGRHRRRRRRRPPARPSTSPSRRPSPTRWPRSGRSDGSCSPPSIATRTPWPTTTSRRPSGS